MKQCKEKKFQKYLQVCSLMRALLLIAIITEDKRNCASCENI